MHIINPRRKEEVLSFNFYWRHFNLTNMHIMCVHGMDFGNLFLPQKITTVPVPVLRDVPVTVSHSARGRASGVHSGQRLWGEDHPEVERTSTDLRDHHSVRGTTNTRFSKVLRDIDHPFEGWTDLLPILSCFVSPAPLWIGSISLSSFFSSASSVGCSVPLCQRNVHIVLFFYHVNHFVFLSLGLGIRCRLLTVHTTKGYITS